LSSAIEYGIDLGTTNSCITRWEGGAVRVFQNNDQMNVTPSAVHILKSGRIIVGRRAHSALLTDTENVSVEFKRWLGQKDRRLFPSINKELSAEELSAEVLKSLREDVRRQTGEEVQTAVITVPAAFGSLQCEATARAAGLAGLLEAPLLQEPIAAAIGYGINPGSENQRWLVFDLGGGTLDIAVVSTKDGRLNILEHRGNNILGGKDIDRLIVEKLLLPALQSKYDLSSSASSSTRSRLRSRLTAKAEEAKIDLSRETEVIVSLFDIGTDDSGTEIDTEISVSRDALDAIMEPMMVKCCAMAREALAGARMSEAGLDRILLVGGPTQSPFIRKFLSRELGVAVDFSVDPMTVVARGAAIYAATLERTNKKAVTAPAETVVLKLAYDPVSSDPQPVVAGIVTSGPKDIEVKLDAEGGHWTSGWMKPSAGFFESVVTLTPSDVTTFWIYARDLNGDLLSTEPSDFKMRQGLVPSAPPLPHTLSLEIVSSEGKPLLDPVFSKGTPLPAEKSVKYRAAHAVYTDRPETSLAIKLWEGEYLNDPDTNDWVSNLLLSHDGIKRSLPQGAEIEVYIKISASRLIDVSAFVPLLGQHFTNNVYLPQREEQDYSALSHNAAQELRTYTRKLQDLESTAVEDVTIQSEVAELRKELVELQSRAPRPSDPATRIDPDDARRLVEESKNIRGRIGRVERKASTSASTVNSLRFTEQVELAEEILANYGTALDKSQLAAYKRELERLGTRGDDKAIGRVTVEVEQLRWRVLLKQDWYWVEILDGLDDPTAQYSDRTAANDAIQRGRIAAAQGDGQTLREAVRSLWKLQPVSASEELRERSIDSGLRRF
jgi:molecular chaperone DnaK